MFEKRLRIFLSVLAFALLVLVVRLAELQLVHGAHYRARAEQAVISAPSQLPFVRGTIRDRRGEPDESHSMGRTWQALENSRVDSIREKKTAREFLLNRPVAF